MHKEISIATAARTQMVDITEKVRQVLKDEGIRSGLCYVFVPHTTAGITINENADPDVCRDFLMELNKIVPFEDGYHHQEGNSAAHIKASMMGFSQLLAVNEGKLVLGTWQGLYFCEFDGPRHRKFIIKLIPE